MIFVIDTSSSIAALATIDHERKHRTQVFMESRGPELTARLRAIARDNTITRVAVATGPGSFTGLRVGVSFALGLAIGLRIPIVPLPTLELQAARSDEPVIAVSEAGRGRFYYLVPGGKPALDDPAAIPSSPGVVGRLSPAGEEALRASGHVLRSESSLRPFVEAAERVLETAREVPYGSLKLEYMQSFSPRQA